MRGTRLLRPSYEQRVVTIVSRMLCLVTLAVAGLSGCGLTINNPALFNGASTTTTNPVTPATPVTGSPAASIPLQGYVGGDQWAISGASIQLYAMGTQGPGSASTALLTQPVLTDSNGNFTIDQAYACPTPASQLYLIASGGSSSQAAGVNNPAIRLLTMVGPCSGIASTALYPVNEVTTIGFVWPMKSYIASGTQIGSSAADSQFAAAGTTVNQLVNLQKATAPGSGVPAGYAVQTEKLNTLANDLHACVVSAGGSAGDGSVCGQLFSLMTAPGTSSPTDTLQAALQLAEANSLSPDSLFQLAAASPVFEPVLVDPPSDWDLDLVQVPATPVIQPAAGTYPAGQQITIAAASSTATLHYTLDGSTPTQNSSIYEGPLSLTGAETVRAIAVTDEVTSPVAASAFTVATPHLVFTSQPSNINSGGAFSPAVAIGIVDDSGKPLQMSVPVTLTLASAGTNSNLNGVTSATTSGGAASYPGLSVSGSGTGFSLVASGAGMASVSSSSFSVTAAASQTPVLAFSLASGSVQAGSSASGMITASKAAPAGGMKVQVGSSDSSVLSVSPSTVTIAAGQTGASITFAGVAQGSAVLTASSAGATSGTAQVTVDAVPPKATHLVFSTQPSSLVSGAVFSPAVTVSTVDDSGKVIASAAAVTLSMNGAIGGAALTGVQNSAATNGVAAFPGLAESTPGNGFTLIATSPGLGSATSAAFNVTQPAADVPQISMVLSNHPFAIGASLSGTIALSKPAGAGGLKVQVSTTSPGVVSVTPALLSIAAGQTYGLITYSGLSAGSATVIASAAGSNTASAVVTVMAPAPALPHLVFTTQPSASVTGATLSPSPSVSVVDSSGNPVTTSNTTITLTLATSYGGTAALSGTYTQKASHGIAVFPGLSIGTAGTGYILTAASADAGTVESNPFTVTAAPVSTSAIPSNAVISSYLESSGGWKWNHDPGTPGSSVGTSSFGISNPSMNGAARVYSLNYSGHGGEIYHLSFGLDTIATHFVYESYIYIVDPTQIQNIEMDMNHVMADGRTVILGTQCANGSKSWEFTKVANGGTHWYASNIPCDPRSWTPNTWHHVQIASHHDSNGVATYDWVNVDGVTTSFQNATGPSVESLGWQKGDLLINFQLDGYNKTTGAITVYTNKMAMYRW